MKAPARLGRKAGADDAAKQLTLLPKPKPRTRYPFNYKSPRGQLARLQLTARCLHVRSVFLNDVLLIAELFGGRGQDRETSVRP
jgi:hypothetical protein